MMPEIALNYTVETPFSNIQYCPTTVTADPQALQLLPSTQLLLSKKQEAEEHFAEPRPVVLRVTVVWLEWTAMLSAPHTIWILPAAPSATWSVPAVLSSPVSTPGGPPGLPTLPRQPILHSGPATEAHCYLPACRNGSSKKAKEFVVYMDCKYLV